MKTRSFVPGFAVACALAFTACPQFASDFTVGPIAADASGGGDVSTSDASGGNVDGALADAATPDASQGGVDAGTDAATADAATPDASQGGIDAGTDAATADAPTPECTAGDTQCTSDAEMAVCTPAGQWGTPSTCQYACVNGSCGGVCVPGTTTCSGYAATATCGSNGQWEQSTACPSSTCQQENPQYPGSPCCTGNACACTAYGSSQCL
jgi:hypothetical protein